MVYLTGVTHGDFARVEAFHNRFHLTANDTLIILGDAGFNYYGDKSDVKRKETLNRLPFTVFCVHGNHEMRPMSVLGKDGMPLYHEAAYRGGIAYVEDAYPRLFLPRTAKYLISSRRTGASSAA